MKHPDLNIKHVTVKDTPAYRVRMESWECAKPKGMLTVDIIQECVSDKGDVTQTSTYNFHMTRDEIKTLCQGLLSV